MSETIRKLYAKLSHDPVPYPLDTPGARSETSIIMDQVIEGCAQEFEDALRGISNIQRDHIDLAIARVRALKQS